MTVIPNGFDFSAFDGHLHSRAKARMELGFDDGEIVVGTVGRFDPLKDFHNFVTAASHLAAKRSSIKFLMVGRNIEWSNHTLRGWIEGKGLVKDFRLVGEQSDVPYFLSAMDIFCLSSLSEAFSNVVVEAMAMGRCVWSRWQGMLLIFLEMMILLPVNESASLFDALLRMLTLPRRSAGCLVRGGQER